MNLRGVPEGMWCSMCSPWFCASALLDLRLVLRRWLIGRLQRRGALEAEGVVLGELAAVEVQAPHALRARVGDDQRLRVLQPETEGGGVLPGRLEGLFDLARGDVDAVDRSAVPAALRGAERHVRLG